MSAATWAGAPAWPWLALLMLGALHGLNPGMGWLFALGLGIQHGERRAVWRALLPLAAGHGLAIAAALVAAATLGQVIPLPVLRWVAVLSLVGLGVRQLRRHWHPRVGGMRVGGWQLVSWSFLVASAHGAGLMAAPFALGAGRVRDPHAAHAEHAAHAAQVLAAVTPAGAVQASALVATLVHTAGYLLVAAVLAVIVYERGALHLLRRAWVNLDLVWAVTLIVTAGAIALT